MYINKNNFILYFLEAELLNEDEGNIQMYRLNFHVR